MRDEVKERVGMWASKRNRKQRLSPEVSGEDTSGNWAGGHPCDNLTKGLAVFC